MVGSARLAGPELLGEVSDMAESRSGAGYTRFINGAELDHAQDIIADVMDTVLRRLRPPFRLAKFEGDAAIVYAIADNIDGSLLQDAIESAY